MPVVLVAYLAFIAIALPDSLLGVAWPSMRRSFDVPLSALGLLLPLGIGAYVLSSSATGFVVARIGIARLLTGSTALSALALFGTASAPALWVVIGFGVLLGLGAGAIDGGLNAYAATHFGARRITWMHASYCLGATAGPLLITALVTSGQSWRWAYAAVAAVLGLLAATFGLTARRWGRDQPPSPSPSPRSSVGQSSTSRSSAGQSSAAGRSSTSRSSAGQASSVGRASAGRASSSGQASSGRFPIRATVLGATAFAVQTAIDGGTALWSFVFLTAARGISPELAGATVSAYWAAMFVGRLALGPVAERIGVRRVIAGGIVGGIVAAALMTAGGPWFVSVAGVVLIGFAAAPMFPLLTLTTKERVGDTYANRVIGIQVAASSLGGASVPAAIGLVMDNLGTGWFAPCALALAGSMGVVYLGLARTRSPVSRA